MLSVGGGRQLNGVSMGLCRRSLNLILDACSRNLKSLAVMHETTEHLSPARPCVCSYSVLDDDKRQATSSPACGCCSLTDGGQLKSNIWLPHSRFSFYAALLSTGANYFKAHTQAHLRAFAQTHKPRKPAAPPPTRFSSSCEKESERNTERARQSQTEAEKARQMPRESA